jgi:hypothetical protein
MSIKAAIEDFTERLHHFIESDAVERARAAVLHAFGAGAPKKRGRPPKMLSAPSVPAKKNRRKGPVQLCPVPYCRNPAAPIFGMVCAKHKDVAKSKIKKYREARKAKKEGVKPVPKKAPKRRVKAVAKKARSARRRHRRRRRHRPYLRRPRHDLHAP